VASENGASSFKKEALLLVARVGKKRIHGEKRWKDFWEVLGGYMAVGLLMVEIWQTGS